MKYNYTMYLSCWRGLMRAEVKLKFAKNNLEGILIKQGYL